MQGDRGCSVGVASEPPRSGPVYLPTQPGLKLGDLYARNMSQPYVLQRLAELEAVGFLRLTLAVNENVSWSGGFGIAA